MHKSILNLRTFYRWPCFLPFVPFCKIRVYLCSSVVNVCSVFLRQFHGWPCFLPFVPFCRIRVYPCLSVSIRG
jgi:hypothetical protein